MNVSVFNIALNILCCSICSHENHWQEKGGENHLNEDNGGGVRGGGGGGSRGNRSRGA